MIGRYLIAAIAGLVGLAPTSAWTAVDEEMRFVVVRSAEPGCEPACPEWISAEGEITRRSDDRLRELIKKLGNRRLPLVINSPGGDVTAAMAMGRAIRKARMDVAIGSTSYVGCLPADEGCAANKGKGASYFGEVKAIGTFCNSACPLVLAGGMRRIAETYSTIGLHQVTTTITTTKVFYQTRYKMVKGRKKVISKKVVRREKAGTRTEYEMSKAQEKELRAYLDEQGVDPTLVDKMKETKASEIGWLNLDEAVQRKLVDPLGKLAAVVGAGLCNGVPAASNCRLITTSDI